MGQTEASDTDMTAAMQQVLQHVVKHGFQDKNGNSLFILKKTVLVVTSKQELLESTTRTDVPITNKRAEELLEVLS